MTPGQERLLNDVHGDVREMVGAFKLNAENVSATLEKHDGRLTIIEKKQTETKPPSEPQGKGLMFWMEKYPKLSTVILVGVWPAIVQGVVLLGDVLQRIDADKAIK